MILSDAFGGSDMIKENVMKYFAVFFALGIFAFGLITAVIEAVKIYEDNAFFEKAVETKALCTGIRQSASARAAGASELDLEIVFDGITYNISDVRCYGDASPGDEITAYIFPESPASCRLDRIGIKGLLGCAAIMLTGLITAIFSAVNLRAERKKE